MKTPGQLAYERDVAARPRYLNSAKRKPWNELRKTARDMWEREAMEKSNG